MVTITAAKLAASFRKLSPAERTALVLAAAAILALGLYIGAKVVSKGLWYWQTLQGQRLNSEAWVSAYEERNLPVPPDGPRDGYWGARLGSHQEHPELGWILPALDLPGLVESDDRGMQHYAASGGADARLLIVGGSTAFGAYASSIDNTYFARLGRLLAQSSHPFDIIVLASGAWKSVQEVKAIELYGLDTKPDIALFLNGLNDVTNGSSAHALFGEETETLDGSDWHLLYHEHDYTERARLYLDNMRRAQALLRSRGIKVIFALQPALFEKPLKSEIERELEIGSLKALGKPEDLLSAYAELRTGLADLAREDGTYFVDASRVYAHEKATVFADLWHFADPGHEILARFLADRLLPIVSGIGQIQH